MKGSVSNVAPIADCIGVKPSFLRSLAAVMTGNLHQIKPVLPTLSKIMSIGSISAIEQLIYLAHGNTSKIYELSKKHSKKF